MFLWYNTKKSEQTIGGRDFAIIFPKICME